MVIVVMVMVMVMMVATDNDFCCNAGNADVQC